MIAKMIIAMGSNLPSEVGSPEVTLNEALRSLERKGAVIRKVSDYYQTPCFPAGAGPDYVNAAFVMEAAWDPLQVLKVLHEIEQEFGRERDQRWGQRTLDLDLVAYDDLVSPDLETYKEWRDLNPELQKIRAPTDLILPHPRVQDRAFVLVPLADIANDWVHPVSGVSVAQMLDALPSKDKAAIKPLHD